MVENFSLSFHTVMFFILCFIFQKYSHCTNNIRVNDRNVRNATHKFMTTGIHVSSSYIKYTIIFMPKEKHSSRVKSTRTSSSGIDPRMTRVRPAILFLALLQQRIDYGVVRKLQTASVRRPLFGIIVPNRENAREDEYRTTRSLSSRLAYTNAS